MHTSTAPVAAIVRTDGEPQQFPCWIVGGEFFYSADEAGIAAQATANSVGDTIRVYLQRDRKSSRETWQRVEPERIIRLIPLAPVPSKPAIVAKPRPREPHAEDRLSNRELILHRADIMVANRQLLLVGLLQLHPHCSGCGMELIARPNEANTAILAGTRLSCKGCSAKLKEETLSEIHQEIRVRNLTSKKKRVCGKRILMEVMPTCWHCDRELQTTKEGPYQAHLVRDRLSCHAHRQIVRDAAIAAKSARLEASGEYPKCGRFARKAK